MHKVVPYLGKHKSHILKFAMKHTRTGKTAFDLAERLTCVLSPKPCNSRVFAFIPIQQMNKLRLSKAE